MQRDKLDNYYYEYDLVGEGFGNSLLFERLGTDVGPWTAKDENGEGRLKTAFMAIL